MMRLTWYTTHTYHIYGKRLLRNGDGARLGCDGTGQNGKSDVRLSEILLQLFNHLAIQTGC